MWKFGSSKKTYYFCTRKSVIRPLGAIAQLVEQRTENPCVPGSIPGGTTTSAFPICTLGAIAQLVEQRTENPCVPGSIPGGTTRKAVSSETAFFVCCAVTRQTRGEPPVLAATNQAHPPTEKGETTLFVVSPFPVFGTLLHSETRSRAACAEIQPFRRNHACLAARNKRPNHV